MVDGQGDGRSETGDPEQGGAQDRPKPPSFGPMGEHHWSRARRDANQEALSYLRWRSHAPGVEAGGAERNHYCMNCHGVVPLQYNQREAADPERVDLCPHCGAALPSRVRAMFNWVEIDQPPPSDRGLKLVLLLALVLLVAALGTGLLWALR